MKKALSAVLTALLCAGLTTAIGAAWEENTDYVILADSIDPSYVKSTETLPPVIEGELLTGKVFVSVGENGPDITDVSNPVYWFDGDNKTYYHPADSTYDIFGGVIFDQAYRLTEVRVAPAAAEGFKPDNNFGMLIQGSNDGIHWVDIIHRLQDALSFDYTIYTPQTSAEYAESAGVTVRTDESIFWKDKGGSYQMYRVTFSGAGEIEFYGVPEEPTYLDDAITSAIQYPTINYYYGNINIRNVRAESREGSLSGTVIGAGGAWNRAVYETAFTDDHKRAYESPIETPGTWVGLMFDEPMALTEVWLMPKRGAFNVIPGAHIQGSNDGINWVTLTQYAPEDVSTKQEWIKKPVTDPNGYLYVRLVTDNEVMLSAAELRFFGAPAPAGEPVTFEPLHATLDYFNGELDFLEEPAVSVDGSLAGQVFGYGHGWRERDQGYARAWDGNVESFYCSVSRIRGLQYFTGLKPEAPTAIAQVRVLKDNLSSIHYLQGSNDGANWTTLATFPKNEAANADGWFIKDITDTTEYAYFRFINDGCCDMNAKEIRLYTAENVPADAPETTAPETTAPETNAPETNAPETAAPETAAPETAAPETNAPETAAPETAAPETAAPETAAPETAAPETAAPETNAPETNAPDTADESGTPDMVTIGIIVAAVVVIAVIAIVIGKKKKK